MTLGFILLGLGSVPSNVFSIDLDTLDGTDPKVDRVKPKVLFSPVYILANRSTDDMQI